MRIHLSIIISIGIYSCDGNGSNRDHSQENTSTIIEPSFDKKNAFLSRPEIMDSAYQSKLFLQVQGLWHLDKIERIEDEEVIVKNYEDFYFNNQMQWPLDYPCSWPHKSHGERVYMTEDSIFFSTDGYAYLTASKYEIKNDTLLIFATSANGRHHVIDYYIRKDFDQAIIDSLYATGFNKKCLTGIWNLDEIFDDKMENYPLESASFNYIPKQLNIEQCEIHGNLIYIEKEQSKKFKLVSYRRRSEDFGGGFSLWLEDIEPTKEGYTYIYHQE